jgi:DNA-directed RNA polymerase subunit RPC12/RpoP
MVNHFSYSWSHPTQQTPTDRLAAQKGFTMSAVTQYRCEMCGTESSNTMHWFMIRCNANELRVLKWDSEEASLPGTRHYCGEAHAGVYISRWLESSCSPSRPDFNRPSAG